METSRKLTSFSSTQSPRLYLVLPNSHLRSVVSTGVSESEVTLDRPAHEGTKQIRPDAIEPIGSFAARLAFGGQGRGRGRQRRDGDLGQNNPENVRSDAKDC